MTSFSDELGDRIRAIGNLVEALQRETRKTQREANATAEVVKEHEIAGGYGSVALDRYARLKSIQLNKEKVRGCSPDVFSAALVATINAAEERTHASLRGDL